MSIEVSGLTKIYGAQKAIDNISFEAKQGQIIGLLGPNGAGKTTTMKILTCFMPSSSGTARICGMEAGIDDLAIKQIVGYLPEHNPLYGTMYIKEYLHFVASIHKLSNKKRRVDQLIDQVGLGREQNKVISSLSKGYKQRVGLAQALIHDPKVLILDEPISGLDPNQLIEIRNLISQLKEKKTIIFSSHILQEVESICDKVVILDKGKIVADDQLSDLNSGQQRSVMVEIELLNEINMSTLQSINEVVSVEKLGSNKYGLLVEGAKDIREDIFDLVIENNNKLLGMKLNQQSLETIFKSVTNEKN